MTTTDDSLPDLGPAAMAVAALVDRVTPDQLDDPTPCPDYAVRNVLGHLSGLSLAFRDAALKHVGPTTDTDPGRVFRTSVRTGARCWPRG